ncbi:MAG: hypothetical protein GXP35_17530 [Actinobacteria bacterium]|nr:hypothetical protein [Actinomycetota bacterium]
MKVKDSKRAPKPAVPSPRLNRGRTARVVGGVVAAVVGLIIVGVVLFVAVFPTGDYLAQRDELDQRRIELTEAREAVALVEVELDQFNDRISISRIARERFSLVTEGDQLFRLTTRGGDTADIPDLWMWPGFERLVRGE